MALIKLRTAAAPRSAAREALAVAIANHAEAQAYLGALKTSLEWDGAAATAVRDARKALQAAEEALADARADTVTRMGGIVQPSATPVLSIREGRAKIASAEELLDIARIARSGVEAEVAGAETTLSRREWALRERALDVLKDEVGPRQAQYIENFARLRREFEAAGQAVNRLFQWGVFAGLRPETQCKLSGGHGDAIWEGTLAALMADPDAELPA